MQGLQLSAGQLCELLPLVQAADLAVPVDWLEQVLGQIQVWLSVPGSRTFLCVVHIDCH